MLGKASLSNSRTGLRFAPTHTPQKLRETPPSPSSQPKAQPARLCSLLCLPLQVQVIGRWEKAGELSSPEAQSTGQARRAQPSMAPWNQRPAAAAGSKSPERNSRSSRRPRGARNRPPLHGLGKAKQADPGAAGAAPLPSPKYNLRRGLAAARLTSRNFGTLAGKVGQKFLRTAVAAEGSGGARSGGG